VDEAFFLGGLGKHRILEAFKPHIFFDDQDVHLEEAAGVVPAGKVPYRSDSPLRLVQPATGADAVPKAEGSGPLTSDSRWRVAAHLNRPVDAVETPPKIQKSPPRRA